MYYYMGIDVGTQGVRCVVSDAGGQLAAARSVGFERLNIAETPGWYEQSPAHWQAAAETAIADCMGQLKEKGIAPEAVRAISIDGTSGTIVPLDAARRPLMNGIMYNDPAPGTRRSGSTRRSPARSASWAMPSARPIRCPVCCG